MYPDIIANEDDLERVMSEPTAQDVDWAGRLQGDLLILGAAGKMGPSLALRARRAVQAAGGKSRVIAVFRRGHDDIAQLLANGGVEVLEADLLERAQVDMLPPAPNVIYMVGRKFGSTGNPALTWAMNAWIPSLAAERYGGSRVVVFSTGNVYPLTPVESGGATEATPTAPVGEYAWSALARERMFEYFALTHGVRVLLFRLNYAIDMRYGVLYDIGTKVWNRVPVDLTMGHVNVIWQGDANSAALRSLDLCRVPAEALNVTGTETLAVRALAWRFAEHFACEPVFTGQEAPTALLSNSSLMRRVLGEPAVSVEHMIRWTAHWIRSGGRALGKPTHFEARDGRF